MPTSVAKDDGVNKEDINPNEEAIEAGRVNMGDNDLDPNAAIAAIAEDDRAQYFEAGLDDENANDVSTDTLPLPPLIPPIALPSSLPPSSTSNNRTATSSEATNASPSMAVGVPKKLTRSAAKAVTTARKTTAKSQRKNVKGPQCRKGVRVQVKRKHVKSMVKDAAYDAISKMPDDINLYGTVVKSCGRNIFEISFDVLPSLQKTVSVARRHIQPLALGAEEPEYSHRQADNESRADACALGAEPGSESEEEVGGTNDSGPRKGKKINYAKQSMAKLMEQGKDQLRNAKTFHHEYGPGPEDKVIWDILGDGEEILEDVMTHPPPDRNAFKVGIPWNKNKKHVDYNDIFFKHFFVDLTGKAKLMDEFLSDERCDFYHTVKNDNIKFHRPDRDDPDCIVSTHPFFSFVISFCRNSNSHFCSCQLKLCVTLMIAGANEVQRGVENLWKRGESVGLKDFPNFAQYLPVNYFRCFTTAFPFLWADKKYWYMPKHDIPWDMFEPFVGEYNTKRTNLLHVVYLILDETMSGWRPKTSATGGLPNITFEPRKPVDLGTMFKNAIECCTGIFVNHDIVRGAVEQGMKDYTGDPSSLPRGEPILGHTAEVLRQCEKSQVKKGGWIGGDAWFGSIPTVVELMKKFGVHSTFIVKNNMQYFPGELLRAILLARHNKRPAGHWVVMKTVISDVPLFIMVYAWSHQGLSYMVTTCGTTVRHVTDYTSKFEDGYGNTSSKQLPRPAVAHLLYDFLPLIDEHNKTRQNALALERKWPTKNCWFRLITTFVGMAVVDLQRWDRCQREGAHKKTRTRRNLHLEFDGEDIDVAYDFDIMVMADLIAKGVRLPRLRYRDTVQPTARVGNARDGANDGYRHKLERLRTRGKLQNSKGKASQRTCYWCRKHGETRNTQWVCTDCGMSLCNVSRRKEEWNCVKGHLLSDDVYDGCGNRRMRWNVPEENLNYKTRSKRKAEIEAERHGEEKPRRRDLVPKSARKPARKQNTSPR